MFEHYKNLINELVNKCSITHLLFTAVDSNGEYVLYIILLFYFML
jgi:hypothetical protein